MLNVLWLASWYPSRVAESNGDFIERHALAVSKFVNLTILFVVKDETLSGNTVEVEKETKNGFTVYKVYYGKKYNGIIERFYSLRKSLQLQKEFYKIIAAEKGVPDIVHVHVAMKAGLLALWLKKKYQIPYVVTEHWTGYYQDSIPNIYDSNLFYSRLNKKILQQATYFFPVSNDLGKTIRKYFIDISFNAIPNAVNTDHFFYKPLVSAKFRFIHPSYLNYQKNPEGIVAACKLLVEKSYEFELLFLGSNNPEIIKLAEKEDLLNKVIFFKDEVAYPQVATYMQQSNTLLLFSRFENLPCVILEALCCGLPVISTNVGGVAEVVNDTNGILVENENVMQLAEAMQQMIANYADYDQKTIAETAGNAYNFNVIGREYAGYYKLALKEK